MRFLLFLALILISVPTLNAQGVVVNITRAGIGATPDGPCSLALRVSDCQHFDGVQDITVAPGAQVALFLEWQNNGSADFREVRVTDQNNDLFMPVVTQTLFPTEIDFRNTFFTAPMVPGTYTTLLTLTAIDFNDREDTDQFRFFITVDQSLPAELADFQAHVTPKEQVDLAWRTVQEFDNDQFIIERSNNGHTFQEVGAVAGAGTSSTEQQYRYRDHTPFTGQNFYRLRQVDHDGTTTYSKVVEVNTHAIFKVYPNPADESLSLAGFAGGWVEIYDGFGRRMIGKSVAANGSLPVEQLVPGRYLLRTEHGQHWWVKR